MVDPLILISAKKERTLSATTCLEERTMRTDRSLNSVSDRQATSPLLFGPCGWAAEQRLARPSMHVLERLSTDFDCVEIGASRNNFLQPEIVNVWARKVTHNPNFRFSVVLHKSFTEDRLLDRESIRRFASAIQPLQARGVLGCVLMRFPWAFRLTEENRLFFVALRRAFHMFPLVAEMRHRSWTLDEGIGTFLDYNVGFCNVDVPEHVNGMLPTSFLTAATGYVRLCREFRDEWGRVQPEYSPDALAEWKDRIDKVSRFSNRTFVVAAMSTEQASEKCAAQIQLQCLGPGRSYTHRRQVKEGAVSISRATRDMTDPVSPKRPSPQRTLFPGDTAVA
jgi:uncharacterized protein YecE (DUF72 family)